MVLPRGPGAWLPGRRGRLWRRRERRPARRDRHADAARRCRRPLREALGPAPRRRAPPPRASGEPARRFVRGERGPRSGRRAPPRRAAAARSSGPPHEPCGSSSPSRISSAPATSPARPPWRAPSRGPGHATTLVSGGMPAPLVSLGEASRSSSCRRCGPPEPISERCSTRRGARPIRRRLADRRERMLLDAFGRARPDVLVTELFPFGRRVLAGEFWRSSTRRAAMRAAPPRRRLGPRHSRRARRSRERIAEAHARASARSTTPCSCMATRISSVSSASWPRGRAHARRSSATPAMSTRAAPPPRAGRGRSEGIVVSGGSSAASLPLYRAALARGARS